MRQALAVLLVAVVVLATAASAGARSYRSWTTCTNRLSPTAEMACARYHLKHATDVLRFVDAHPSYGTGLSRLKVTLNHRWLRRFALAKLAEAKARLVPPYPPHHSLWTCIERYEGSWSDTSAPYTGGLQMHLNWYGVPNAGYLSQLQQEWAAENAWKANGYSYDFLYGQWFEWDNADGCYSGG